jgi:hypothetical protein
MRARGTCRQPTCNICGARSCVSRHRSASIGVWFRWTSVKACNQCDGLSGIRLELKHFVLGSPHVAPSPDISNARPKAARALLGATVT